MSAPSLETLAVVAYRQPTPRSEVEAIRGVQCGELLRQLMERDLVRIVGRSEEIGRPFLYGTTKRFLEQFGLRRLEDLPVAELRVAASRPAPLPEFSPGRSRLDHTNHHQDCEEEESL
jgi:segregation and condensation protein B